MKKCEERQEIDLEPFLNKWYDVATCNTSSKSFNGIRTMSFTRARHICTTGIGPDPCLYLSYQGLKGDLNGQASATFVKIAQKRGLTHERTFIILKGFFGPTRETIKAAVELWYNTAASLPMPLDRFLMRLRIGKRMQRIWGKTIHDALYAVNGLR